MNDMHAQFDTVYLHFYVANIVAKFYNLVVLCEKVIIRMSEEINSNYKRETKHFSSAVEYQGNAQCECDNCNS